MTPQHTVALAHSRQKMTIALMLFTFTTQAARVRRPSSSSITANRSGTEERACNGHEPSSGRREEWQNGKCLYCKYDDAKCRSKYRNACDRISWCLNSLVEAYSTAEGGSDGAASTHRIITTISAVAVVLVVIISTVYFSCLHPSSPYAEEEATMDFDREPTDALISQIKWRAGQEEKPNRQRFCVGVTYLFFACWAYGAIPQHFWIIYIISFAILIPVDWMMLRQRHQEGAFKEFCWYANFMSIFVVICLVLMMKLDLERTAHIRVLLFAMCWATSTGVLAVMAILNGNQLTFNSVPAFGETFIHVAPTLVMYTLRWQREVVGKAYPQLFRLNDMLELTSTDIFNGMICTYIPWWICYLIWGMAFGIRRTDALDFFSRNMERIATFPYLRKVYTHPKSPPVIGDVLILMFVHALCVLSLTVVAMAAFYHYEFHVSLNIAVVGRMVILGSLRLAKVTSYYEAVTAYSEGRNTEIG